MAYGLPNGSTVDVAATYSLEVGITGISNANPAVVTAPAHGLADGDIVLITSGWSKLTGKAFRVTEADTDTFELEKVNTTDLTRYPAGAGIGSLVSVDSWVQISQVTGFESAGGEQNQYTFQFLEEDDERQIPTNKTAVTVTITVADDPEQPYVPVVEAYDESKARGVVRLNLINKDAILYPSIISITSTPTATVNELMTRTITLSLQARTTRYSAIA